MEEIRDEVVAGVATPVGERPATRGAATSAGPAESTVRIAADHAEGVTAFLRRRPARSAGR